MCSPHVRSGGLCSTSLTLEYLHLLLGIFLHGKFVSSSFIYLLNNIFVLCRFMGIYFIIWGIIQYHLFCCLYCSSFGHCFFLCSFDIAPITVGVLFLFWTLPFLAPQDAPGSSCIFPALILESAKEHCFLLFQMILETKIDLNILWISISLTFKKCPFHCSSSGLRFFRVNEACGRTVWPWASHLISLSLSLLIRKVGQ